MNLLNAATSGVDPQTGSYLSKKQRVTMFRQSLGQSGGFGGASGSGFVRPQTGIAVRNNMAEVVEKLQVNTFQAIENVDAKVDVNKKDISALVVSTQEGPGGAPPESASRSDGYAQAQSSLVGSAGVDIIQKLQTNYEQGIEEVIVRIDQNSQGINDISGVYAQDSKNEAQAEKLDTRSLLRDRQRTLRALREKLVEGIGSAVGKIQSGIQNVAAKVNNVAGSFLQKLGKFIALFGLAWLVDNYETLSAKFRELFGSFESLKAGLLAGIGNVKGVWSLIDIVLRKIWKLTSDLVGTLYRVAKWTVKAVYNLVRKVFGALGRGFRALKDFFNPAAKVAPDVAKGAADGAGSLKDAVKPTKSLKQAIDAVDLGPEGPVKVKPKGIFGRIGEAASKLNPFKGADDATKGAEGKLTKEQDSWLKKFIKPLTDRFPKLPVGGLLRTLRGIPAIGMGIDIAINKNLDGESWMYSIISGIMSGGAGYGGALAGAKLGFGAGALAGSAVPVVGTAIGGAMGSIIGGILGGYLAGTATENIVDKSAEALGIDKTGKGGAPSPGSPSKETETPKISIPSSLTEGLSTPAGMGLPSSEAGGNVTNVDLGTEVIDASSPKEEPAPRDQKNYGEVNPVPTIITSDPQSDFYRSLATTVYDLAY